MKLKIYDSKKEIEPTMHLRLKESGDRIFLEAVDEYGAWVQNLLAIESNGTLNRFVLSTSFADKYGIQLDDWYRIVLEN